MQEGAWYSNKVDLGSIFGVPAYSFTSPSICTHNNPCDRYLKTISDGLFETYGMTGDEIKKYLSKYLD